MAISDSDKIDYLWKKVVYGAASTADPTLKGGSNETISSPLPVYSGQIWAQSGASDIPPTPPTNLTAAVRPYTGANRIRCTTDPTVAGNVTWLATSTYGTVSTRLTDFIPASFGAAYAVSVYIGDPNVGPAYQLPPDAANEEWVFDYNAGVLTFPTALPGSKTATIGTGTVTVAGNGIYIVACRYVGTKGVVGAGTTSRNYVVADIASRNALTQQVAGDTAYVIDASGIPADAGAGEYAMYMWTGSAWSLLATQDSSRTDAKTSQVVVGAAMSNPYSLGYVGNNARVESILVQVTTAFDQPTNLGVGTTADNQLLVAWDDTDLSALGKFMIFPDNVFGGAEALIGVYLSAIGAAPTTGSATVTITYV